MNELSAVSVAVIGMTDSCNTSLLYAPLIYRQIVMPVKYRTFLL